MKNIDYEILKDGISNTADVEKGKSIFYKCKKCQSIISSVPKDNVNCLCGNIGIDKDLNRLFVEDFSNFIILKKKA